MSQTKSWSEYWKTGAQHSCTGSYTGNYSGAIQTWWENVYSSAPNHGNVLDIGCGNGSLLEIASMTSKKHGLYLNLFGLDAAQLNEKLIEEKLSPYKEHIASLSVFSSTPFAKEALGTNRFSVISSQYALEYFMSEHVLADVVSSLSDKGNFSAIMHHHDSVIYKVSKLESEQLSALLGKNGIMSHAIKMIPFIHLSKTEEGAKKLATNHEANALKSSFNTSVSTALAQAKGKADEAILRYALEAIFSVFNAPNQSSIEAMQKALIQTQDELINSKARLDDLLSSALGDEQFDQLLRTLTSLGMHIINTKDIFHQDQSHVGRAFLAKKLA